MARLPGIILLGLFSWLVTIENLPGQAIRIPITRDTWVSTVGRERDGNNGASSRLKAKGIQEFFLLDIDAAPLRGRIITGVSLHLTPVSPDRLRRLTLSTISSPWAEGKGFGYARDMGGASFNMAVQGARPWAFVGSDITAVIGGEGNGLWSFAEPVARKKEQVFAIAPALLAARVAGLAFGFCGMDDVGSEYERRGNDFKYLPYRNRFIASKDSAPGRAPYFMVHLGGSDSLPPLAIRGLKAEKGMALPPGQAALSWLIPADPGGAGTMGFLARYKIGPGFSWGQARVLPAWLVPLAGRVGDRCKLVLRDLDLSPGKSLTLGIRPVDGAGNIGPLSTLTLKTANPLPFVFGPAPAPSLPSPVKGLSLGGVALHIVDPLDKVVPGSGRMIPAQRGGYLRANHLFSGQKGGIRLYCAKNEFVGFQLVLRGPIKAIGAKIVWSDTPSIQIRKKVYRQRMVVSPAGPLPDPLVPLSPPVSLREEVGHVALQFEFYAPHATPAGLHRGSLRLTVNGETLTLPLVLRVWDFTLPDQLSFIPEMNCYNLPPPPLEVEYYRLAHAHRTCLNRLPYGWRGNNVICPPRWDGKGFDFRAWDKRFGPLLDGSAFADLPRSGVPVDSFYLPLNEDWPLRVDDYFQGGYWVDRAFKKGYGQGFTRACREFGRHLADRGWDQPIFHFYLNNKVYHKKTDWRRSSAPWIFDEPVNTQDFLALAWYGKAFHAGVGPVRGRVKLAFRGDISRPQWQRNILDGVLDINVCGGVVRKYHRRVIARKKRHGEITYIYGSTGPITGPNTQPLAWCLEAWQLGLDGVLPWQTVGRESSWDQADRLALFYPGKRVGVKGPVPSIRLQAYRRGQQDVEYLNLLQRVTGRPHFALARAMAKELGLVGSFKSKSAEDAGTILFTNSAPAKFAALRRRIGAMLDRKKPRPQTGPTKSITPLQRNSPFPSFPVIGLPD